MQITSQAVPKQQSNVVSLDEYKTKHAGDEALLPWENNLEIAKSALAAIPPDCGYDVRQKIGMALKAAFGDEAFKSWHDWIKRCGNDSYKGEAAHRSHWISFKDRLNGKRVTLGSLYWHAEKHGWQRPKKDNGKRKLPPLAAAAKLLAEHDD